MKANATIAEYVERLRQRSSWLARVRLASLGVLAAVLTTVVFAVVAAYVVPSQDAVVAARVALYVLIAATLVACVRLSVGARRAVRRAERRVPVFDGRLRTWFDASRRTPPPALLGQLGSEAADVAKAHPPQRAFPTRLFAAPAALAVLALGLLAWFQTAAPQHMRLPAERLLLGDAFADTRPRIIVDPGNTVVSRGTDVLLRAEARGFATDGLRLHATFAGAPDWELADMLPSALSRHEFVMVAVTEPVDYFVSAGSVRSDRFRIEVADLPVVDAVDVVLEFPTWTRLEPHRQDHGDVAGVRGTEVAVTVGATAPMVDAKLVMDDRTIALDAEDAATFAIEDDGTWHVAATHRGELVRISESFLIEVLDDLPPEVEFAFPGRDRSASAIEEVALRFRARDDFGVEALDLHYAVNGGAWTVAAAAVEAGERDALSSHLLSFEDLEAGDGRAIRPGDVVSFFAEARDRGHAIRSALYFVDVRPFDKRYRQRADGGGGGGGAGGGSGGLELSARQRDITAATWNLIRERDAGTRAGTDLDDQIDVVGILQTTLKDQVDTMIVRSEGRRLSFDEEVSVFVEELKAASVAMETAAATLTARDLDAAVAPEQRALQHLLTAEASLRDIDVTLTRSDSSGDAVSRSLSELADLELDPTRNRYETPETPSFGAAEEADDDEWERLTELARRHEELARQRERGETQETPLSRWQLERLKRELETLRERLAGAESGQTAANRTGEAAGGAEIANAIARLERAMDDSNPDQREAEAEAFRQGAAALRDSAERLRQRGVDDLAGRLRKAEEETSDLLSDHRRIGERLEELQQELLRATRAGERRRYRDYGFDREAQTKRRMQDDLTRIAADLADIRQRVERVPESGEAVARQIDRALDRLAESRINERLGLSAEYFETGNPLFVIAQENRVGSALEDLRERLDLAATRMESVSAGSGANPTVDDLQGLRRRLQDIGVGGRLSDLEDVASAARRLGRQLQDGAMDMEAMRARYRGLGASEDNRERLYRLTLAELDRLEIALGKVEAGSVRATPPRDSGYESAAVARYFRQLSCDDC